MFSLESLFRTSNPSTSVLREQESVPGSPPVRGPGNDGIDAFCQQASESSFSIRCNAVYLAGDSTLDEADDIMSKFLALPTLSPPGSPKIRDELEGPSVPANAVSPADVYSIQTNDVFIPVDLEEQRSGAVEAPADFCFSSWDDENGCQRGNVSPLALTTTASLGRVAPTTEGESHATFHDHPDNEQPKLPPPVAFTIPTNPTGHCRKSHPPGSKRYVLLCHLRFSPRGNVSLEFMPPSWCSPQAEGESRRKGATGRR